MSVPETLNACLERAAARPSIGVRFVTRRAEEHYAYAEIAERAARVAGGLQAIGVEPYDRIAIAVPTSVEFYDAYFGTLLAGAVPAALPLPRRFGPREEYARSTEALLRACDARLVLASERLKRALPCSPALGVRGIEELPEAPPARVQVSPDAMAIVQFTSGTTSTPKAIALTHEQVLSNVRAILRAIGSAYPEENGVVHHAVSWLPLYHDMGLVGSLFTTLAHPAPLTLMSPDFFVARPARWLQIISKYRATISAAPHFAYALCLDRIRDEELAGVNLESWRLALDGAETVTPGTLARFHERFSKYGMRKEAVTPVYGLAEAGLAVTFSDPRRRYRVESSDGRKLVSAGRPLDGFEVRIEDGRILVRGPSIMSGYLGQPEPTGRALRNGWLDTGDEGFLRDGELFLTGRSRDKIVLRGTNYSPELFEETLESEGGLRPGSVAALGAITESGEELCIVAEKHEDTPDEDAISATLSERTGIVPFRVLLLEPGALPRTSSGKIRRAETAKRFSNDVP